MVTFHIRLPISIVPVFSGVTITISMSPYGLGTLTSQSMTPVIEEGDLYIVAPPIGIERGEIIVHKTAGGMLASHRRIDIIGSGYITKGDNNTDTHQFYGR